MMPETAQEDGPAGAGCREVRQRMDVMLAEFGAVIAAIQHDPDRPDNGRRMTSLTAALREVRDVQAGHALGHELLGAAYQRGRADERAAAARVPAQRRGRHTAAGAPRPGWQRAALRVIPVGMLGLAARILSAHRVLAPAALAAAIGGTAVAVQMQPARTVPDYASTAPAPAASIYAAAPMASPAALTRPRTAVRKARRIATQAPADGPTSFPVPSLSPSPSSLPSSPAAPLLTVPAARSAWASTWPARSRSATRRTRLSPGPPTAGRTSRPSPRRGSWSRASRATRSGLMSTRPTGHRRRRACSSRAMSG